MKSGTTYLSQIVGKLCPNGHRSCLSAECWLQEKKDMDSLTQIAEDQAQKSFVPHHLKSVPKEELHERALGIAISQWARWDGHKIMRVFASALEDANFHTEAAIVSGWINKEE